MDKKNRFPGKGRAGIIRELLNRHSLGDPNPAAPASSQPASVVKRYASTRELNMKRIKRDDRDEALASLRDVGGGVNLMGTRVRHFAA